MNKGTVLKYELKRLVLSKEYLLLLAATMALCVSLIRGTVLFGVRYTAPFSRLTFSTYCSALSPFFFVLLLVLCARQNRTSEKGAEAIISTTAMPLHTFRLIRYSSVLCAFLATTVLSVAACFMFYAMVFDFRDFGGLICSGSLIIIPSAIFLFGSAMFLGNWKPAAIYALLAVVLIPGVFNITLPDFMDIFGSSAVNMLYMNRNSFSSGFITGRIVLSTVGIVLMTVSLWQPGKGENK